MQLHHALRLPAFPVKPIIALTGAGGKSSLLFRLGEELRAAGVRTLLTSTTHLAAQQADQATFALFSRNEALLHFELPTSLEGYGAVLLMAGLAETPDKLHGLDPALLCRLAALPEAGAVLIEADGSRGRPLKAPAAHEPVVPACVTHTITVAGMAALGQPLTAAAVHRPDLLMQLTGLLPGAPITPEAVAAALLHPDGGLRGCPPAAVRVLYLNLTGDATRLPAAQHIADRVLAAPERTYDAVLIGSAQAAQPVDVVCERVAAVVLAAGRGSRLDATDLPKPLLPWQPEGTLVGRAVACALAAQTVQEVVVVTGYRAAEVQAALADQPVRDVFNPEWASGQGSSVAAGVRALSPHTRAALFLLADQPTVQPATLDALVHAQRAALAPVVAPVYADGQRGNPVLFDQTTFAELGALTGDTGGRAVLERYGDAVQQVAAAGSAPAGIETMADYRRAANGGQQTARGGRLCDPGECL